MTDFDNKLVAVMNKSAPPGKIMNALAHMCIGFGASLNGDDLHLIDYVDSTGGVLPQISKMPFIILRASGSKLRNLRVQAALDGIPHSAFTHTMTIGSWKEQLVATKETDESELVYLGVVLCGPNDKVSDMTKKFSLWT